MVRVDLQQSLDDDQGEEGERQEHLANAAAGGGFHGSIPALWPDQIPLPGERDRIRSQASPAPERLADRQKLPLLSRLRVDGPDRGGRRPDEPGGTLLAAADPLAALEPQGAGVEGVDDAVRPEVKGGEVFHTVDTMTECAFRVKPWVADFTKNPMFIGLKLGSIFVCLRHAESGKSGS